ncbi:MAG: aspartate/glutamate racemase family protein [Planctomycetota bacterium]|nr:aspartate/glutamate racemase family protein [Planctomycetota bacterium]
MRTLGLLGGMSWESTIPYYRIINETVKRELGDLHSAPLLLHSFDFTRIERLQADENWIELAMILTEAARNLVSCGAQGLVICSNTMHRVAQEIQSQLDIPLLHIVEATAQEISGANIDSIGLLGTRFTMEQEFYRGRLKSRYGLKVVIPDDIDRTLVHRVIYDELCQGVIRDASRIEFLRIIEGMSKNGAQGVILGCTEISLLVPPSVCPIHAFDTTAIHAEFAAQWALGNSA